VSDQVHGISTLKVSLTRLEYVVCRKRLKILRLANLSVEAILQTKFRVFFNSVEERSLKIFLFYWTNIFRNFALDVLILVYMYHVY
jgi:hypothetical protein